MLEDAGYLNVLRSLRFYVDVILNKFRFASKRINYVVPSSGWSVDWDGEYITRSVNNLLETKIARVTTRYRYLRNQVIHFGSIQGFLDGGYESHKTNRVIVTIFHGDESGDEKGIKFAREHMDRIDLVVTACSIMETRLKSWGFSSEKVVRIPLGVDLQVFRKQETTYVNKRRKELNIPDDSICIGSFQKDGEGWGEGLTPKLIKGPDVFVEAVTRLATMYPVFVLLTGPARGYVKQKLAEAKIPFRHDIVDDYVRMVDYYNCLDICLITSREEGGPKALLESLACGVPLVTTDVGMVRDIINNGENGFVSPIEDIDSLIFDSSRIIDDPQIRERFTRQGFRTISKLDWSTIGEHYYQQAYSRFMVD